MDHQQFCLKWNNFSQHLKYAFNTTWSSDDSFTDVVLAVPGGFRMRTHRMVLSACSNYFKQLLLGLSTVDPVLILHDVSQRELEALVRFMYHGEVNVSQEVIPGLLRAAENLQIRGLCATSSSASSKSLRALASGSVSSEAPAASGNGGRAAAKRSATDAPSPGGPVKRFRVIVPGAATVRADGQTRLAGNSADSGEEDDEATPTAGGVIGQDDVSDGEAGDGRLRIDEESNGLEPETVLDEQDTEADGWSLGSSGTEEQFFPLPRSSDPPPISYTAMDKLKCLAVGAKLEPRSPNELEAAIVATMPRNGDVYGYDEGEGLIEGAEGFLAFHEPRPCPHCQRTYRDASTLRTHLTIMHTEGLDPYVCSCGSLFRTKYAMNQHKRNGHPPMVSNNNNTT